MRDVLVVATTNQGKWREIQALLAGLPIDVRTLADYPAVPAPEETGATFAENARQKALYYGAITGALTVAEDSGLEIDALGGAPGVHSARFGGEDSSYAVKFALIYQGLADAGVSTSRARFVCARFRRVSGAAVCPRCCSRPSCAAACCGECPEFWPRPTDCFPCERAPAQSCPSQ